MVSKITKTATKALRLATKQFEQHYFCVLVPWWQNYFATKCLIFISIRLNLFFPIWKNLFYNMIGQDHNLDHEQSEDGAHQVKLPILDGHNNWNGHQNISAKYGTQG
jgi:hypothetical protein